MTSHFPRQSAVDGKLSFLENESLQLKVAPESF